MKNCYSDRIREAIGACLEGEEDEVNPMRFVGIQKIRIEKPATAS